MKTLIVVATAFALAGCQCGPGVSCKTNAACEPWGVCGANGYCLSLTAQGAPRAVVPATQVDLGLVGCGAAAKTQKITITNAGTGTLSFSTAIVNGIVFSVTPSSGELLAEQTAELTVSGQVPGTAVANTELVGVLTLNVNEAGRGKIDLPLKLRSSGVTLTLMPTLVAFGSSPVGDPPQTEPLELKNIGNLAATLTFTQPADDQFSLAWTGGPAVTLVPAGLVPGLVASFKARRIPSVTTFAPIAVAEPVCGSSVGTIPMSGRGQSGVLTPSDTDLFFGNAGRVDCGSTAAPKTFTLRNTGNAVFSWTGALGKGASSPFSVSPTMGTIFAGTDAGVTLTVTPLPVGATASTAVDAFGDIFSITTSISGDAPHPINLHQTANGAVLSFSAPTVDFGLVPIGNTSNAPVSVINDGNAGARVSFSSSNPKFALNPGGPLPVDGGTTTSLVATFTPDASVEETGQVAITVDAGVLCAPLPVPLAMGGTGSTGSVSFTPVGLDFGAVNCGTSGAPQTVTFSNSGNQSYSISPALVIADGGSAFAVSMNPPSGLVASDGGTVVITVVPKPIPQRSAVTLNLYGDTLKVTTDVNGDDAGHLIPLRMTARGAIFGISTAAINFGTFAVGSMGSAQFTIENIGNAPGTIGFAPGMPGVFGLPPDAGIAGNSAFPATGTFSPQVVGPAADVANIAVSASTVLCQPLPFTSMQLDGQGTASNALAVSTPSLFFGTAGMVPCGTTAPAKNVTVTNNSAYALTLTLSLETSDGGSPYTVSGPASLGAGDAGVVTVTPKPRGAISSTAPDFYADTLAIRAVGGPINETQVVALHQTAQGAILTFFPTSLHFSGGLGTTHTSPFTVNNVGNLTAPYTLTVAGATNAFSVTPTASSVNPGNGVTETVKFVGELLSPKRSATISIAPGAAMCGPLPAPVQLSSN